MGVLYYVVAIILLMSSWFTLPTLATTNNDHLTSEQANKTHQLVYRDYVYDKNVTYISSTSYNPKGMGPLYKIANQVLSLFIGRDAIPDGK